MASERPTAESLPEEPMARLLAVMAWLRDRQHGCPWDVDQTFKTIAPYTIEEAYEVADAIERDDMPALKEELGDLLLQVVYHAQMASEAGAFGFADVAAAIADKMVDRHPHVFGDARIADGRGPDHLLGGPQGGRARPRRRAQNRPVPWTGWRAPFPRCCAPRRSRSALPGSASTGRPSAR